MPRDLERRLRSAQTGAEQLVWNMLRRRRLGGLKFRRQHPVSHYILDFYCPEFRLAIELDGEGHFSETGRCYDEMRSKELEALGIQVLRFENSEVLANPHIVAEAIAKLFPLSPQAP